jgi:hypothetical protein
MQLWKITLALGMLCAATAAPILAQEQAARVTQAASPEGVFVDKYGTSFTFSFCGESGTNLCGILNDVQGKSRTQDNLQYVGHQVMQAAPSAPNKWKGSVIFNGAKATATVSQTGPNTVKVQGCRGILCQTLSFNRAS